MLTVTVSLKVEGAAEEYLEGVEAGDMVEAWTETVIRWMQRRIKKTAESEVKDIRYEFLQPR